MYPVQIQRIITFSNEVVYVVEGPTAKSYALRIRDEFGGEVVREVFAKSKKVFIPLDELIKKRFLGSDSLGKNIILFFDGIAIRLHLMMFGAIHIYKSNEELEKPIERVRLMIKGEERRLIVYNAPIVEIDRRENIMARLKAELGPDPLSEDWDMRRAIENLKRLQDKKIGVLLLDQSAIAGIGNILRNEILFRARIHPERLVKDLSDDEIERIVDVSEELMRKFLELKLEKRNIKDLLFVYNKYRGLCRNCGNPIRYYRQEPINRKTFVCENCQR